MPWALNVPSSVSELPGTGLLFPLMQALEGPFNSLAGKKKGKGFSSITFPQSDRNYCFCKLPHPSQNLILRCAGSTDWLGSQ